MSTQEIKDGVMGNETALILARIRTKRISYGLDQRHMNMLNQAKDYKTLVLVAVAMIKKLKAVRGDGGMMICVGPLNEGGLGLTKNLQEMLDKIDYYNSHMLCFNQLLFFEKIEELKRLTPEKDPMEEFFFKIIHSGHITHLCRCPYFTESKNALAEIREAEKVKLEGGKRIQIS